MKHSDRKFTICQDGSRSDSLLYLNSNNSDGINNFSTSKLSPYHRKQVFILSSNSERFISQIGIERVGFLTLTFPDNVKDNKEASRRFNNMNRKFLSRFFGVWMLVKERQKRGAWHYHILIDCRVDIRSGINWDEISGFQGKRPVYRSARPALRNIWRLLRESLPSYGFGRSELLPLKTSVQAVSRYVGKYISNQMEYRPETDKGVRLTSYSHGFCKSSTKMQWHTEGSQEWRKKLAKFADLLQCSNMDELKILLGSKWAYLYEPMIMQVDTLTPPEIARLKTHAEKVIAGKLTNTVTGEVLF